MNDTILKASALTHQFSAETPPILNDFNLDVRSGEKIALIGRSGSGKTTLLHLLSGLQRAQKGQVLIQDKPLHSLSNVEQAQMRNQMIGFVYQTFNLMQDFSAIENIALVAQISGINPSEAYQRASTVMKQLGIDHLSTRASSTLSGGEKQRVAIARAIVNQPALLFADEPTGNLDRESAQIVMESLNACHEKGQMTLIMATHDLELAQSFDRMIDLKNACEANVSHHATDRIKS